jgi:cytochrome b561
MTIQNAQPNWRYTRTARWLHWTLAVLIIVLLALGWTMMALEHRPGGARSLFDLHKSLGLAVLVLVAARLVWRLTPHRLAARRPDRPARGGRAQAHPDRQGQSVLAHVLRHRQRGAWR